MPHLPTKNRITSLVFGIGLLAYLSVFSWAGLDRNVAKAATLSAHQVAHKQTRPDTFYGGYYTVEEMQSFLDRQVAAHPTLAEKVDIGDSWCKAHPGACTLPSPYNGYDLWLLHITNRDISGPKPVFWFDAGIHSREIATPEVAMRYISWLLGGYGANADATWLVDYHDIWVMPMFNPDGHHIVEAGGNNPYYQRKNANNKDGCTIWPPIGDQFGVDLNRNFPFMWNCCGGSNGDPCSQNFRGTSEASEGETRAVVTKIRELIPDQRGPNEQDPAPITTTGTYQNMHSHGMINIAPWGHSHNPMPNEADIANIAEHMRALDAGGNGYPPCDHCASIVDGSAMDWVYGELGAAAYATEISGGSFFPSYQQVGNIWNENRSMLVYMAKIARTPYLLARGPDANDVTAVPMTVTLGSSPQLTATINYSWTNNSYVQNVAAAEYYLATPPWAGGTPLSMSAVDGNYDSPTEGVHAIVPANLLTLGRHLLMVRGRGIINYEGYASWGPISAAFVDVVTATATPTPTSTPQPCQSHFLDVHPPDYYYEAVVFLYCQGAISGYGDATFRPFNNATRGQMAKVVVLAEGWPIYTPLSPSFIDVPGDHPFYQYVETAYQHGIISGYGDNTFRPGSNVTRGQLVKIVVLAEGWALYDPPSPSFIDVPTDHPFYSYTETAFQHSIMSGYSDHTFRPGNPATRGQISKIVYNAVTGP